MTQWAKSNATEGKTRQWNWRFDRAGNRLSEQLADLLSDTVTREEYDVNEADQITYVAPGGPLHVSGSLDEQGKIVTGLSEAPVLTEADGSFNTWVDTEHTTGAYVTAADWNSNTTSTRVGVAPESLPSHDFEYDANGNTTRVITTSADGLTTSQVTYEWDAWDQLVAVVKGVHRSEFTYDGQGRRVRIREIENGVAGEDRWFVWEGLSMAEMRYAEAAAPAAVYLSNGVISEGYKYYFSKDHLGSLRQTVDESGNVAASFSYDAYGNVLESGDVPDRFDMLYTGHYYHRPSGLYLAPFRAYDPKFGKWINRDPIGHDGGMNLYGYVGNNPVNFYDPTGLQEEYLLHDFRPEPLPKSWYSLSETDLDRPDGVWLCERKADVPGGSLLWMFGIGHRWVYTTYGEWGLGPAGGNIPNASNYRVFNPTAITDHSGEIYKEGTLIKFIPDSSAAKLNSVVEPHLTGEIWLIERECHEAADDIIDKGR